MHSNKISDTVQKIIAGSYMLFVFMFLSVTANGQNNAKAIADAFNSYQQQNLQEKVFVHTDKTWYAAGEILWFKLYVTDAFLHRPLSLSKVAYVELLDQANKPALQAKIELKNGAGSGSVFIPVTINSGNYTLRAYTNWMKNFGTDIFFKKQLTIINTQKSSEVEINENQAAFDIQFFPEGGNLVYGLKSRVGFKATDKVGNAAAIKGTLLDNGNAIVKFEPLHEGMGSFVFAPQQGHHYKAAIILPGGKVIEKELPQPFGSGYVMSLQNEDKDKLAINIQSAGIAAEAVYLVAHNGTTIKSIQTKSAGNGAITFSIDKSVLADGVSCFTLLNEQRQPLCERLYFKKPSSQLDLSLSTDNAAYSKRSKVNISLQVMNQSEQNDSADFSFSVYKIDSLQAVDDNTIDNYLLLTSALKGYVTNPSYYFSSEAGDEEINDLLLTQGWRRFNWNNISSAAKPVFRFAPEYNGHIVTGTVVNTITGKPQEAAESYLSVPGTRLQFYPSVSDSLGHVKFETKNFYGSSEIAVQAGTQFDSIYRLEIDNPFFDQYDSTPVAMFQLPASAPNTLLERSIAMQVQNVYAGDKLRKFTDPAIDTMPFFLHPDKTYMLDDYTRFQTIEEVLREYVALVDVAKRQGHYHFPVYNFLTKEFYQLDPLNLLDGVPVFNLNRFMEVDPLQIRKLEVIHQRYIYGGSSYSGILNWTSYKGDLAGFKPDASTVIMDYDALQLQREFYAPVYDTEEKRSSHFPDFRNMLFWSPTIKTKGGNLKQLSFYTSDIPGKYAVLIQGITSKGMPGSKTIFFDVEK